MLKIIKTNVEIFKMHNIDLVKNLGWEEIFDIQYHPLQSKIWGDTSPPSLPGFTP